MVFKIFITSKYARRSPIPTGTSPRRHRGRYKGYRMATLVERKLKAYSALKKISALVDVHYPALRDAKLSQILARLSPARHSADFRSVRWFGTDYAFTPSQAAIIRQLWRAWENNTPKVGAGRLLSATDLVSDKISELFKRSEAWGVMVKTDGVGVYWLSPP